MGCDPEKAFASMEGSEAPCDLAGGPELISQPGTKVMMVGFWPPSMQQCCQVVVWAKGLGEVVGNLSGRGWGLCTTGSAELFWKLTAGAGCESLSFPGVSPPRFLRFPQTPWVSVSAGMPFTTSGSCRLCYLHFLPHRHGLTMLNQNGI